MASFNEWYKRGKEESIARIYDSIENLGLQPPKYEEFQGNKVKTKENLQSIEKFIQEKHPCLFIWDPTNQGLKKGHTKGYFFDLSDFNTVENWIKQETKNLSFYTFLITTQITNPGNGFVASAISNGKGDMVVETYHKPHVCNHRALSRQNVEEDTHYFNAFTAKKGTVHTIHANHITNRCFLQRKQIEDIIEEYWDKKGYFECVYGSQEGNKGVFTTGYEPKDVSFPHEYFALENQNIRGKLLASII